MSSTDPNSQESGRVPSEVAGATAASPMSGITDPATPATGQRPRRTTQLPSRLRQDYEVGGNVQGPATLTQIEMETERCDLQAGLAGGTESDDEGEDFDEAVLGAAVDRMNNDHVEDDAHAEIDSDDEVEPAGDPNQAGYEAFKFDNAPEGWSTPTAPEGWFEKEEARERKTGEPPFAQVDNPGDWDPFVFQPEFKSGSYVRHKLPTNCGPVPIFDLNADPERRKRKVGDWEFFYKGYQNPNDAHYRSGATKDEVLPKPRESRLDIDLLVNVLGLDKSRMIGEDGKPDALFFYQLLFPICEVGDIQGDPRKNFYQEVAINSSIYAAKDLRIGVTGHGSTQPLVDAAEFARWDGSLIMDGVKGGSNGAFYRRWHKGSESHCKAITDAFTKERWHHIKRIYKLNVNGSDPKRGEEGYDPCYKYSFIWDTLLHNCNAITKKSCDDQCIDESSFPFNGYGEPGSGNITRVKGKPGCRKGGQIVLSVDADRLRPRAVVHRHKCLPSLTKVQGQNEVMHLHKKLKEVPVVNNEEIHFTFDNYFSGGPVYDYACEEKIGITSTVRRDRLPSDIPGKYLHKEKTNSTDRPKAARYIQPVICARKHKGGTQVLTSFQSTSSCNIMCVNALNRCSLFGTLKERGQKKNGYKRQWLIEMNEARQLYLCTYNRVDVLDHYIQLANIHYVSWKYWHASMNHAKAAAVAIAFDIYKELAEGSYNPEWKMQPVEYFDFREQLARQMLKYDPKLPNYPGDEKFRTFTQQHKDRRPPDRASTDGSVSTMPSSNRPATTSVTAEHLEQHAGRICGDLDKFSAHWAATKRYPTDKKLTCAVCGKTTRWHCTLCDAPLHKFDSEDRDTPCVFEYHNACFLGLAKCDYSMLQTQDRDGNVIKRPRRSDWKYPTEEKKARHSEAIKRVLNH